jgi:3D (Asp-Asp-Asp) domain-containing protein
MLGATLLLSAPDAAAQSAASRTSAADSAPRTRVVRHPARRPVPTAHRRAPTASSAAYHRAKPGEKIPVEITYYCLQGTTRTDSEVREGIVAADPRVFPLRRHVELTVGKRSLGRFLIADTGSRIKGRALDIWVPSCAEARRRGRHRATAVLLTKAESRAERAKQRKLDEARKREALASK